MRGSSGSVSVMGFAALTRGSSVLRRVRLAAAVALLAGTTCITWAASAPEVGKPAPALVVQELDGHPFDLAALRGKVVIVNFWATWCSPCRAEMPVLDAFYRHYHGQGVELLGLSIDDQHDRGDVGKVMQKFTYPAALAANAKVNDFGSPLAVPMTYVIDPSGVVRARLMPGKTAITEESLAQTVLPLLPHGNAAPPKT